MVDRCADEHAHMVLNKTSPEPQMWFNLDEQMVNDAKYLSYVDKLHSEMNSKIMEYAGLDKNESSSEIYSQHRLRSSSSERERSTVRLEETQGKLYIIKKIDEQNTVKIPKLDLDNIIQKQKRKMYPYNINTQGEIIELSQKESSLDTHNDEDAIIIYDEQDQEEDTFKQENSLNHKHSNLFNSSFLSELSSVHKENKGQKVSAEKQVEEIKDMQAEIEMIGNNSFLDQDLNIGDTPWNNSNFEDISVIRNEVNKSDKNIIEAALGFFDKEDEENSPFSAIEREVFPQNNIRKNNFMRDEDNDENITSHRNPSDKKFAKFSSNDRNVENVNNLNQFLEKAKKLNTTEKSRDLQINILDSKNNKAKSVPADERKINEDQITFGKDGWDMMDDNQIHDFDEMIMHQNYDHNFDQDDNRIRNKSIVIPRSSVLLKNKKNLQKQKNQDSINAFKNFSVSPSKIVYVSKKSNPSKDHSEEEFWKGRYGSESHDQKKVKKSKILFKANRILLKDESNPSIHEGIQKSKIKLVRNKIAQFKFIKHNKGMPEHSENYGYKSKL
jgi:hypothetical protein